MPQAMKVEKELAVKLQGEDKIALLIEEGMLRPQRIDGEDYYIITEKGMSEALDGPVDEVCFGFWNILVNRCNNEKWSMEEFIFQFCAVHASIKNQTDGNIDFATTIGTLLIHDRL